MSCCCSVAIGRGLSGQTGGLSDSSCRLLTLGSGSGKAVLICDREPRCLRLRGTVLMLLLLLLLLRELARWELLRCAHGRRRLRQGTVLLLRYKLTLWWVLRSCHRLGSLSRDAILVLLLRQLTWRCLLRARSCCGLEMVGKGTVLLLLLLLRCSRNLMRLERDTISLLWDLARLWLLRSRHGLGGLRERAILLLLLLWKLSWL